MSMHLYNEDDPSDDEATRLNKAWRREQLERMLRYQQMLNGVGLGVQFSLKQNFDIAANNNDSTCFLTNLITDISPAGAKKSYAVYDNHFTIHYEAANGKNTEAFTVNDLDMDYTSSNRVEAELAVLEKVKSAMLLVHTAKAAGWTKVNFMNTTDPVSRYALGLACKEYGLDIGEEKADVDAIPKIMFKDKTLADLTYGFFNEIKENPYKSVAEQKHKGKQQSPNNDNNSDSWDFDIAA